MKIYIIIIFFPIQHHKFCAHRRSLKETFLLPIQNIVIKIQLMGLTQFRKSFFFLF